MENKLQNPVEKYIEFKAAKDKGFFSYYDKEKKENVEFDLGEFSIIKTGYVVQGWHDEREEAIFSNEISNFSQELRVATKSGQLFKGRYNKTEIAAFGGKLFISLTILVDGKIMNLKLKGVAYFNMNNLLHKLQWNFARFDIASCKKVKYTGKELEGKAVKYYVPQFEVLEENAGKEAEDALIKIKEHFAEKQRLIQLMREENAEYEMYSGKKQDDGDKGEEKITETTDVKVPF